MHSIVAKLSLLTDLVVYGSVRAGGAGVVGVGWWVAGGKDPCDRSLDLARIPAGDGKAGMVKALGVGVKVCEMLRDKFMQMCGKLHKVAQMCSNLRKFEKRNVRGFKA